MKKIFSTSFPEFSHLALLFFRIAVGALMLTHGVPKLQKLLSGAEIQFADPFGFGPAVSLVMVIFAEFLCSILVMIGLATRLAVIPLMITMLTATLYAHADDPFSTKEKPLLFFVVFAFLLVLGSGRYSIDRRMGR
jgi:putative oxidoreductase